MKKVLVKSEFYDKFNHSLVYSAGAVVAFNDERAACLVETGLVEYVTEPETPVLPFVAEIEDAECEKAEAAPVVESTLAEAQNAPCAEAPVDEGTEAKAVSETKPKSRKKK